MKKRRFETGGEVDWNQDDDPEAQEVVRESFAGGVKASAPVKKAAARKAAERGALVSVSEPEPKSSQSRAARMREMRARGGSKGARSVGDALSGNFKKGGTVRCRDGCAVRGLTKGTMR